jgi:TonB-dependent starch-binding outer membrane protein SusC
MRTWVIVPSVAAALAFANADRASAQTAVGRITGQVVDSIAGLPIANAQVIIPGTALGATVNAQGRYAINNVPAGRTTVRAQRIGYGFVEQGVVVTAGQDVTADFHLAPRAVELQQVVAVGYGTQRRETITSAISSASSEQFNQTPARDAGSLIAGKIPGLAISTPSGDPRSGTQISLRGVTTIQGPTSPLVLIDGVPGDLSTLAPQDIDQISVLKDASAAALYGSRASNGVILITTKRFEGGAQSIRYDAYVAKQTLYNRPDFLTAADYRNYIKQGYGFQDLGFSTDWEKQVIREPASSRHNLSLTGGASATNYTGSLNWQDTEGIFQKSNLRTVTGRMNVSQRMFNDRLQAELNMLTSTDNHYTGASYSSAWRQALIRNPTDRVLNDQGTWQERGTYMYFNPVGLIMSDNGAVDNRDLRLHGTARYALLDNLSVQLLAGSERTSSLSGDATDFEHVNNTQQGLGATASRNTSSSVTRMSELTANYNGAFREHHYTLLGGYSYQDFVTESFGAYNYGFPTDLFGYNSLGSGSALQAGKASESSGKSGNKLVGFFGRANYDWQNRFLLNGSLRYEGDSRFGVDHKWGMFPAISAGYRLANESFMSHVPWVNELKLRAGYGVTGIAPSQSYLSLTTYSYGSRFPYNGAWIPGLAPSGNPNPNLRWEKKGETNVGVDYSLFRSRVYGSLDVYRRDTRDMLYNYSVPVPPYLTGSILANVGHMMNRGLEAALNWDVIQHRNFSWTTSVNGSHNANRLVSLSNEVYQTANFFTTGGTGEPIQTYTHRVQVGQQIGNFWGWKSVDIDSTGAWIVLDSTGNRISVRSAKEKDKRYLGNGIPKYYAAWNNTARYGNFDFSLNTRGAFKFQILNFQRMFYENPKILQYNMLKSAFDPVYGKRTVNYDLAYVSYYIENGDYMKLDNVTLGYTLGRLTRNATLANTRVYFSGTNLLTLTRYKGMDPEVPTNGLAPGDDQRDQYPTTRTFTAGVSVKF